MGRNRPTYAVAFAILVLAGAVMFLALALLRRSDTPDAPVAPTAVVGWERYCSAQALPADGVYAGLYRVQQQSMAPTLEPDQVLVLARPTPDLPRGTLVVFIPPTSWSAGDGTPFVKRVVAIGGDHVEIVGNRLSVNQALIDEPYVRGDTQPTGDVSSWDVPPGDLFVLGDHRPNSADSRVFGPIAASSVVGVPVYRCTSPAGPIA